MDIVIKIDWFYNEKRRDASSNSMTVIWAIIIFDNKKVKMKTLSGIERRCTALDVVHSLYQRIKLFSLKKKANFKVFVYPKSLIEAFSKLNDSNNLISFETNDASHEYTDAVNCEFNDIMCDICF